MRALAMAWGVALAILGAAAAQVPDPAVKAMFWPDAAAAVLIMRLTRPKRA